MIKRLLQKILNGGVFALVFLMVAPTSAVIAQEFDQASDPPNPFYIGTINAILEEKQILVDGATFYTQVLELYVSDLNLTTQVTAGNEFQPLTETQRLKTGTKVIVTSQATATGETEYVISDVYRMSIIYWLVAGFVLMVVIVAKWRGLLSTVGMVLSFVVLTQFMIPQILAGSDPVWISLAAAIMIALVTIYLSHGFNLKSHLSIGSLVVTLIAVVSLAAGSVELAQLAGLGSEEAYFLQFGPTANINLQGLLLGGIILGALGVLDDIVVSQVSVISQLQQANQKLNFQELYRRGLEVGKDHVASLVNTLVLAYAGANLPLFLLFYLNEQYPLWVSINSQIIAEELVRTLVGSIGLVLAVPVSTMLAAYVLSQTRFAQQQLDSRNKHVHQH